MKKILVIVSSISNSGGVSTVAKQICTGLYEKGIICDFICFDDTSQKDMELLKKMNCKIFKIPRFVESGPIKHIRLVRKIIKEHGPYMAVHAHTSLLIGFSCYAAKKENIKIRVGHAHGSKFTRYPELLISLIKKPLNSFNNKYCTHKLACATTSGKFVFGSDFEFHSNFIDFKKVSEQNTDKINRIKKELGIPKDAIIIGNAGRIGGQKNPQFLIDVFEKLNSLDKNIYLLLIGGGEQTEDIKKICKNKGIDEFVKLPGYIEGVSDIMKIFNVYVNTSYSEGMSISILEAQAVSIPCVVSNGVPGTNDIGVGLFEKCNTFFIDEWIEKIRSALKYDKNTDENLVLESLKNKKMEKESNISRLIEIYRGK